MLTERDSEAQRSDKHLLVDQDHSHRQQREPIGEPFARLSRDGERLASPALRHAPCTSHFLS